ncbi:MAG TPA: FUSC family protein, partial [Acetobacteraceae bacterium]
MTDSMRVSPENTRSLGRIVRVGQGWTMLPSWRDWIFSAKTFVGAMLALWIALRMGLDRPYWAMATAYIVAQPLT